MTTNAHDILGGLMKQDKDNEVLEAALLDEWKEYESKKTESAYDIAKRMFTDSPEKWETLTDYEKGKNSFMINRIFAIHYPVSANNLNGLKSNGIGIVETWRRIARGYRNIPRWVYTKTNKAIDENPLKGYKKETTLYYIREHECSERDMYDMWKLNGDEFLKELDYIEKYIINEEGTLKKKKTKK
jgi:ribosomal protein L39E